MAKKKKHLCKDCVLCVTGPHGLTRCKYGANGRKGDVIFPENGACKMITGPVNLRKTIKAASAEPEPGSAPFCGDFPKCNNAEGCDTCGAYDAWAEKERI